MQDYEKLGAFYLGRRYDLAAATATDDLILYDSRDLTTHGVVVGMTGSGKTGLSIGILEEAAIDGIPVIAIDPKGDLTNLGLRFPKLLGSDFVPWVDPGAALREGMTVEQFAAKTATTWREGLAKWGQSPDRIQRLVDAAPVTIYTPGSSAGTPISLLRSFASPTAELRADADALRQRVQSAVAGLLALVGVESDPLRSREHILLAMILDRAWRDDKSPDLAALIGLIQNPGVTRIGVFDLESFYPKGDRFELAMRLNNLLASPSFSAWMEGEPLDVSRLLFGTDGKPRISVLSIAHLSDAEKMFFVTLLLNEVLSWMRGQSGTSSLRALLYMDEVFGFFPPTREPPAKLPMLTLLKQARAYGLGILLATQNPVDLDYKGLSNAGTWFIGRLQTERDKARVMEGLEGASAASGKSFDRAKMEATIAGLGSRVFLMNNVHEDAAIAFQTRWTLSYLRGPLTRDQIAALRATTTPSTPATPEAPARVQTGPGPGSDQPPVVEPDVEVLYLSRRRELASGERLLYRPAILANAKAHFVSAREGVDEWQSLTLVVPFDDGEPRWKDATELAVEPDLDQRADSAASFSPLASNATRAVSFKDWTRDLNGFLYRSRELRLWFAAGPDLLSAGGESEGEFRVRLREQLREHRDREVEKLRKQFAPKLLQMTERVRKAEERVSREDAQYGQQKLQSAVSFGATVLGALFGRKLGSLGNIGRATTAARGVGRAAREREDVERAKLEVDEQSQKLKALEQELESALITLGVQLQADSIVLKEVAIKPRKSDITITRLALLWTPHVVDGNGLAEAAWATEQVV